MVDDNRNRPTLASAASISPVSSTFSIPRKAVPARNHNSHSPSVSVVSSSLQRIPELQEASKESKDEEALHKGLSSDDKTWQSRSLERRTLLGFAGVFIILLAAIEAIIEVSHNHNGIAYANENAYYLWTYGPVASKLEIYLLGSNTDLDFSTDRHARVLVPD